MLKGDFPIDRKFNRPKRHRPKVPVDQGPIRVRVRFRVIGMPEYARSNNFGLSDQV